MRSILCYLLFAIGGAVTYVCAEEKEQIGSDTLENILFVDDFDAKWDELQQNLKDAGLEKADREMTALLRDEISRRE